MDADSKSQTPPAVNSQAAASPTPQSSTAPTNGTPASSAPASGTVAYKDGEYLGDDTDAFYGRIQVKAIIQNGKITDVQFLKFPNDRETSIKISNESMPKLKQEAIAIQGAKVDIVSGATQTSEAFQQSLQSALNKARG